MDTLLQFLKEAATLESQLYTLNQLYWNLRNQADSLGYARSIEQPQLKKWTPGLGGAISGAIYVGFWPALILSAIAILFGYGRGNWGDMFRFFIICYPVIIVLCSAAMLVFDYKEYTKRKQEYENNMEKYYKLMAEGQQRVKNELEHKARLEREFQSVLNRYHETENALTALYKVGILHKAYQHDIIAITSIYDYLDKGICDSLKGTNGAYARYDNDVKIGIIITKLDTIINKLDEIIVNQRTLADLLQDSNNTLNRIARANEQVMQHMERIEENTELIEYNTRCSMQSNAVMEHIAVYSELIEK